jgi:hypothetical protein
MCRLVDRERAPAVPLAAAILIVVAAACGQPTTARPTRQSRERVFSPRGFSFLPPQGANWREEFGTREVTYSKITDPQTVTFFTGAVEGSLRSALPDSASLLAFVRSKKDDWGNDHRYANTSATFDIEPDQQSCVRYQLSADDREARNRGSREALLMRVVGRFCLHPQDRAAAVDIYYSARYVPSFDPATLVNEGEAFLRSLQFSNASGRPPGSGER